MLRIGEAFRFSFRLKSYFMSVLYTIVYILLVFLLLKSIETQVDKLVEFKQNAYRIINTMSRAEWEQMVVANILKIVMDSLRIIVNYLLVLLLSFYFILGLFMIWARTRLFVKSLIYAPKDLFLTVLKVVLLNAVPLLIIICFFKCHVSFIQKSLMGSILDKGGMNGQSVRAILESSPHAIYTVMAILSFIYMLVVTPLFCMKYDLKDVLNLKLVAKHFRAFISLLLYTVVFSAIYFALMKLYIPVGRIIQQHSLIAFWLIIAITGISFAAGRMSLRLFVGTPLVLSLIFCCIASMYSSVFSSFYAFASLYSIFFLCIMHNFLLCVFFATIGHLMAQTAYVYVNGCAPTDEVLRQQNEEARRLANAEFKEKVRRASGEYMGDEDEEAQLAKNRNNYFDHQRSSFGTRAAPDAPAPIHPEDMVPDELIQEPEPEVKKTGRDALNEALEEIQRSRHNYFEVRNKTMTSSLPSATSAPASASNYFHQSVDELTGNDSSDKGDTE